MSNNGFESIRNVESLKWKIGTVSFALLINLLEWFDDWRTIVAENRQLSNIGQSEVKESERPNPKKEKKNPTFRNVYRLKLPLAIYYITWFFFLRSKSEKAFIKIRKESDGIATKIGWNNLWNYFPKLCQSMRRTETDTISLAVETTYSIWWAMDNWTEKKLEMWNTKKQIYVQTNQNHIENKLVAVVSANSTKINWKKRKEEEKKAERYYWLHEIAWNRRIRDLHRKPFGSVTHHWTQWLSSWEVCYTSWYHNFDYPVWQANSFGRHRICLFFSNWQRFFYCVSF